jgi:hypothetical protein
MFKIHGKVLSAVIVTCALVPLSAVRAAAQVDGGFKIDGTIPDCSGGASTCGAVTPTNFDDPHDNQQELGPVNGTSTKVGVIHQTAPPMLATTNPNSSTDLSHIWMAQNVVAGKVWLYFAWQRDSGKGSSVVGLELQQAKPPSALRFAQGGKGCDFSNAGANIDTANCNPWANRQPGDILLVWDQNGSASVVTMRTFSWCGKTVAPLAGTCSDDVNGNGHWDAGEPLHLDIGQDITAIPGKVHATLTADGTRGEAAINLSDTVFASAGVASCFTVGNVIPGTITGNSDSADYKDTVFGNFSDFVNISSCGFLKVRKITSDGGTDSFAYRLRSNSGADVRYASDNYNDSKNVTGTIQGAASPGISPALLSAQADIIPASDYVVDETSTATNYTLDHVECVLLNAAGQPVGSPVTIDAAQNHFATILVNQTTLCSVYNTFNKGAASGSTSQSVVLSDLVTITLGVPVTSDADKTGKVKFYLYAAADCSDGSLLMAFTGTGNAGIPVTYTSSTQAIAKVSTSPYEYGAGSYYWRVEFTGDNKNNAFGKTACGSEVTAVSLTQ